MLRTTKLAGAGLESEIEKFAVQEWGFFNRHVPGGLAGKDIVEIGPGDVLGLGMLALLHGAGSYTVYDRFLGNTRSPEACLLYRRLADRHGLADAPSAEAFATAFTDALIERRESIESATVAKRGPTWS